MEITQEEVEPEPAIIGGKEIQFNQPAQRIYVEPDYGDSSAVASALAQMKEDILADYAPAFSDTLGAGHVARIDPVTIELTNSNKKPIAELPTPSHMQF